LGSPARPPQGAGAPRNPSAFAGRLSPPHTERKPPKPHKPRKPSYDPIEFGREIEVAVSGFFEAGKQLTESTGLKKRAAGSCAAWDQLKGHEFRLAMFEFRFFKSPRSPCRHFGSRLVLPHVLQLLVARDRWSRSYRSSRRKRGAATCRRGSELLVGQREAGIPRLSFSLLSTTASLLNVLRLGTVRINIAGSRSCPS
jgi:hypothetical protein